MGSVSGSYYCNGSTWATPAVSTACTGTSTVAGFTCSSGLWVTVGASVWAVDSSLGTPGFVAGVPTPAPAAGMMYDAYAAQVAIPAAGYRHVSYVYPTAANLTAMEISLDPQIIAAGGWSSFFNAPSSNGSGSSSVNQAAFNLGGGQQLDFGYDTISGMSWGRWQGSWVTTSPGQGTVTQPGTSNLHWFASPTQNQAVNLPRTGTFNYTYAGGTMPTDNNGMTGNMVSTPTFFADFSNQTVSTTLGVNMPASTGPAGPLTAVTINATANNMPILPGANFKSNTPAVTCTGCGANPVSGAISGQFAGPGGSGVGIGYGLKNGPQVINGVSVFRK
ncbi:MAG: hypothetical protein NT123_00285 [Proteobacteria bacterium]|nr:hypothetical protein [Pseudomonadota bacterium]